MEALELDQTYTADSPLSVYLSELPIRLKTLRTIIRQPAKTNQGEKGVVFTSSPTCPLRHHETMSTKYSQPVNHQNSRST